jgi:GT2 family glycosyltransferase
MFDKYGSFRNDLGVFPDIKIGFEDTEFGRRLMLGGEILRYVPAAIVYHEILAERVCKESILAWWYGFGRGWIREQKESLTTLQILRIFSEAASMTVRWSLSMDSKRRFYSKCRVWFAGGKLSEIWRGSNRPPRNFIHQVEI